MDNRHGYVHYNLFKPHENLVAFTTTKKSFNEKQPKFSGNSSEKIKNLHLTLADQLHIDSSQLVFPLQNHSNNVAIIESVPHISPLNSDGLITNRNGICLCIQTADCVPLLMYDPVENVIAAIHAGWRGTVKKIVEEAVIKMISVYHSSPGNLLVAIGPSIGPEKYEVGEEVAGALVSSLPYTSKALTEGNSGKFFLNLWEANKDILKTNGVLSENIETLAECTFKKNDLYFSARREGAETGRIVSGIMLRNKVSST